MVPMCRILRVFRVFRAEAVLSKHLQDPVSVAGARLVFTLFTLLFTWAAVFYELEKYAVRMGSAWLCIVLCSSAVWHSVHQCRTSAMSVAGVVLLPSVWWSFKSTKA